MVLTVKETEVIANTLFLTQLVKEQDAFLVMYEEIPLFTEEELIQTLNSLQNQKVPTDGVPTAVLLNKYKSCLREVNSIIPSVKCPVLTKTFSHA